MADLKKYTVQEALNRVMNDSDASLNIQPSGTGTAVTQTANGQIKGSAGTLFSVQISFVGNAVGDKVEFLNSTSASGTSLITFTSTAVAQSFTFTPSIGIAYDTGIYAKWTTTSGTVTITSVFS